VIRHLRAGDDTTAIFEVFNPLGIVQVKMRVIVSIDSDGVIGARPVEPLDTLKEVAQCEASRWQKPGCISAARLAVDGNARDFPAEELDLTP
jgi:hypothetical protein